MICQVCAPAPPKVHCCARTRAFSKLVTGVSLYFWGNEMVFIKKLRARVKNGDVTASVRIWRTPRVKAGNHYRLDEGHIRVTSIRQIFREDLTDKLARDTGFFNLIDLMKTAKHGSGQNIYYIKFRYVPGQETPADKKPMRPH